MNVGHNIIQLGSDPDPDKNFIIRTPPVQDGTLEIRKGTLEAPGALVATFDGNGLVPKLACAFSAKQTGSQGLNTGGGNTMIFDTLDVNIGDVWDGTTFKPTIPGLYQINTSVSIVEGTGVLVSVFKNGVEYKRGAQAAATGYVGSCLVPMNGTTDTLTVGVYVSANTTTNAGLSYVDGYLVGVL